MIENFDYSAFENGLIPPPPMDDRFREEQILAEIKAAAESRRLADEKARIQEMEEELKRQARIDDEYRGRIIDFFA